MNEDLMHQIKRAVEAVESEMCERIDVNKNVIVYKAGTVIRIDIKNVFER